MKERPVYRDRSIVNIQQMLRESCELYADEIQSVDCQVKGKPKERTFRELYKDVIALYTAFADLGLFDGRNVGLITDKRTYEWDIAWLAKIWGGSGAIVPIAAEWPPEKIKEYAEKMDVSVLIYADKLSKKIEPIRASLENIERFIKMGTDGKDETDETIDALVEKGKALIRNGDERYQNVKIDENALAAIYSTSGTTGPSRGAMLTQGNFAFDIERTLENVQMNGMEKKRRIFSFLSAKSNHVYETVLGFLMEIYKGASVVYSNGNIPREMKETHPTELLGTPAAQEHVVRQIRERNGKKR